MVKLLRLTTENDGEFNVDFDSVIALPENAQIAVHNLTFESEYNLLEITSSNNRIETTISNGTYEPLFANLKNKQYTSATYTEFYDDLDAALNSTLQLNYDSNVSDKGGDVYCSYRVIKENDRINVYFKYTPLTYMFNSNLDYQPRVPNGINEQTRLMKISIDDDGDNTLVINQDDVSEGGLFLGNMNSAETENDVSAILNYVTPASNQYKFSQGTGIFICSIYDLQDHAGPADTHGFGMGLSFSDVSVFNGDILPTNARDFEIFVEKTNQPYQFISPAIANTPQTATVSPHSFDITVDTEQLDHDRIVIERFGGVIRASIWQRNLAGGTELNGIAQVLFEYRLTDAQRNLALKPYIYIKSGQDNCEVGCPMITFDSLFDVNIATNNILGNTTQLGGIGAGGGAPSLNYFQAINQTRGSTDRWQSVIPYLSSAAYYETDPNRAFQLTINNELLRFMGWNKSTHTGDGNHIFKPPETQIYIGDFQHRNPLGFILIPDGLAMITNSDSYVVELLSERVESFDASIDSGRNSGVKRGGRKNIIAVIPVNDSNGVVEYQAQNDIFIDFDNAQPITMANMRLRILDKNLDPITTNGISVITLLLK